MEHLIVWFGILLITIIASTFLHEIGHGISCVLSGKSVSTGFNKVGDFGKKPSQSNFREEHDSSKSILWDLGVPITLLLALVFSYILRHVEGTSITLIVGSIAYSNSLLRLIPCCNAIFGLIHRGKLSVEDEVGLGNSLKEKTKIPFVEYLPIAISLLVSIHTLNITISLLNNKADWLFDANMMFTFTTIAAILLSTKILNWLDERYRINWKVRN